MKVGLVIEQFCPLRGGAEQWTYQFARRLLELGHAVHVVAESFAAESRHLGLQEHRLPKARSRLHLARLAERTLRTLDLDVIHDMGVGWYCDVLQSHDGSRSAQAEQKLFLLPLWARPLKRALIRVLPRYRAFRILSARQLAEPTPYVIALSRSVAEDYRRYHGVDPRRIRVVHNGVDPRRFSPERRAAHRPAMRRQLNLRDHETVFLFVGHDFQRKGLATVIRAVGRLVREALPVRLLVAGGRGHGRYDWIARRCGADAAVTFLGPVADPVPYYAAADAYVLPSFYDPFGLVVLEAAASGLPVITSRRAGASELLTNGLQGYVLRDPADDRELAERLRSLLDPPLRRRMGQSARDLAVRHTMDRNCQEILAIYREVIRQRAASASRFLVRHAPVAAGTIPSPVTATCAALGHGPRRRPT